MRCRVCYSRDFELKIDFGSQPVTSHYLQSKNDDEKLYKLSMGQCKKCKIVQLIDCIPFKEIIPIYSWVNYNEPENHLDGAVQNLLNICNLHEDAQISSISYKDLSTLERIKNYGFKNIKQYDFRENENNNIDIAITQDRVSHRNLNEITSNQGKSDLLIARHILEHSFEPKLFLDGIKNLLNPDGYVVFEIPDCKKQFQTFDYTALWEDHLLYLTENSLINLLLINGFEVLDLKCFEYESENSLFVIARVAQNNADLLLKNELDLSKIFYDYKNNLIIQKKTIREKLIEFKNQGPIVIFGAGHLATTFMSVMEVSDLISFVVDDSKHKVGLFMPHSKLEIKNSQSLEEFDIKFCLSSLSPESEKKVLANNNFLTNSKISFGSIFPSRYNFFINL